MLPMRTNEIKLVRNCFFGFLLLLSSCTRNLKDDITLNVDDSRLIFYYSCGSNPNYWAIQDSTSQRQDMVRQTSKKFSDTGNDLTVVSSQGDFTLRIVSLSLTESSRLNSIEDPCNSGSSLVYEVNELHCSMRCEVVDNSSGHIDVISEEAEDSEEIKERPTFFQGLIGNDSCYTPRVKRISSNDVKSKLVRRVYQSTMRAIRDRQ